MIWKYANRNEFIIQFIVLFGKKFNGIVIVWLSEPNEGEKEEESKQLHAHSHTNKTPFYNHTNNWMHNIHWRLCIDHFETTRFNYNILLEYVCNEIENDVQEKQNGILKGDYKFEAKFTNISQVKIN